MQLIYGSRDMLETLDDVREKAVLGELEAVVVIPLTHESFTSLVAWRDDMPYYWSRIAAAVATAAHQIMLEGLEDQNR